MHVAPTPAAPVPVRAPVQLGVWRELPELTGTRTAHRSAAGFEIDPVSGFDEYARELVRAWDRHGNGTISANEVRRTQQHLFGSNADGSTEPQKFVWSNTTVRQEVVSMEGLFAAAKGADDLLTVDELRAFAASFDTNGNGYLDTRHHGDMSGAEYEAFSAATMPVVLGARQLTVEGRLEGVGHSIWDRWADDLLRGVSPAAAAAPR